MGRRFKGPLKKVKETEIPEKNEQEDDDSIKTDAKSNIGSADQDDEEDYYHEEEYPEEKYRQLEERMKAMEIQKVPGLDFEELGLIPGVIIPPKFKIPTFSKYDGVSYPKMHLRSYVRKIQPHTKDKRLWIHFFQESLSGTQLEWHYQPESASICTWEDMAAAFYKDPPKNVTTTSPNYDPNAKCAYQSNSPGHHADNCWALKNKIQDMIEAGEIEFDPPETPNVITAPMPNHDKAINAIMDTVYVYDVRDLSTPLPVIKRKMLQAGLFPGCDPDCFSRGLKIEYVSVISKAPLKIPTKAPFKISAEPRVAPVIITKSGPILYSSDKAIPWNYGAEVYIQRVKQELVADKAVEDTNPDVGNIAGTSKVTRSGRLFSPEISPNTVAPADTPIPNQNADTRGKGPLHEPIQTPVETVTENPSPEEANEFLKIIRENNYLGFFDADLSPSGRNHNKSLHISIECEGTTLAHVLVDNGSSLNVLPKMVLDKLNPEGIMLKSSDVIVKAFDGSMSTVYSEVELPIKVGSQTFNTVFYVMDIHPAYSCLLGRPWIHGANVVTSTLHQKLKYPAKAKIVIVYGEEEYVVSFIDETKYVEFTGETFESPRQAFELVPQVIPGAKPAHNVPKVARIPPTMASLKGARAVVEEVGCTIWGQLPDIPYKSNKWGLGCTAKDQNGEQHSRP
ncbi:uncharacterized protein LOC131625597 [Vicia villosa]|uniref:uncharacterized protein LOC131625597 n=1 Tax=Vicia villosa TaxID=3911 RepID=UPI00273BC259|nr:uncharacterized protein LOC131625597 [Vicia villosa]